MDEKEIERIIAELRASGATDREIATVTSNLLSNKQTIEQPEEPASTDNYAGLVDQLRAKGATDRDILTVTSDLLNKSQEHADTINRKNYADWEEEKKTMTTSAPLVDYFQKNFPEENRTEEHYKGQDEGSLFIQNVIRKMQEAELPEEEIQQYSEKLWDDYRKGDLRTEQGLSRELGRDPSEVQIEEEKEDLGWFFPSFGKAFAKTTMFDIHAQTANTNSANHMLNVAFMEEGNVPPEIARKLQEDEGFLRFMKKAHGFEQWEVNRLIDNSVNSENLFNESRAKELGYYVKDWNPEYVKEYIDEVKQLAATSNKVAIDYQEKGQLKYGNLIDEMDKIESPKDLVNYVGQGLGAMIPYVGFTMLTRGLGGFVSGIGEVFGNSIYETQEALSKQGITKTPEEVIMEELDGEATRTAIAYGATVGAVEVAANKLLTKNMTSKLFGKFSGKLLSGKQAKLRYLKAFAAGKLKGFATEASTEGVQTVLEEIGAKQAAGMGLKEAFADINWKNVKEAMVQGGMAGGIFGGVGGVMQESSNTVDTAESTYNDAIDYLEKVEEGSDTSESTPEALDDDIDSVLAEMEGTSIEELMEQGLEQERLRAEGEEQEANSKINTKLQAKEATEDYAINKKEAKTQTKLSDRYDKERAKEATKENQAKIAKEQKKEADLKKVRTGKIQGHIKDYKQRNKIYDKFAAAAAKAGIISYTEEDGTNCASKGLKSGTGSNWVIVKDFKGQPKHSQGGVDISIADNKVSINKGDGDIYAKYGVYLKNG